MSATEELRRLLDERGVEHYDGRSGTLWGKDASGYRFSADELTSGRMSVHMWCDTPEQAVEATLGRGECFNTQNDFDFMCSVCGKCVDDGRLLGFNYCPSCGARVIGGFR